MRRLALFAKWPVAGVVKTRLSPAIPASLACELYRAMLADACSASESAGADERFLYWADAPADRPASSTETGLRVRAQSGSHLGERLRLGFDELLIFPEDRAVVIGADCPELGSEMIREAFGALEACDLVLGPARDGGYFLIGLSRRAPVLFDDLEWGSARVLEQTLERAKRAGLETALLGGLADVDTPEDLVRFAARQALSPAPSGMHTVAALRAMGLLPAPV